jgi:hypothetical protein
MNKWKKIAEIRQDRINELKEDSDRYLDEIQKLRKLILRWEDNANQWQEMYHKEKGSIL